MRAIIDLVSGTVSAEFPAAGGDYRQTTKALAGERVEMRWLKAGVAYEQPATTEMKLVVRDEKGGTLLAELTSFTAPADVTTGYYEGRLSFNTDNVAALLAANPTKTSFACVGEILWKIPGATDWECSDDLAITLLKKVSAGDSEGDPLVMASSFTWLQGKLVAGAGVEIAADTDAETLTFTAPGVAVNAAAIGAEATARGSADTTLQGNIDAEAAARGSADTTLADAIAALSGGGGVDVQTFHVGDVDLTWNRPTGTKWARMIVIGGGGGGGSGRCGAAGTSRAGGGGGSSGHIIMTDVYGDIPETAAVVVGAGGAGGAGAGDNSNGSNGSNGGDSSVFGFTAQGGAGGGGGSTTAGAGGALTSNKSYLWGSVLSLRAGAAGSNAAGAAPSTSANNYSTTPGGSGGGTPNTTATNGGAGGNYVHTIFSITANAGGAGDVGAGATASPGATGSVNQLSAPVGLGGGGGGGAPNGTGGAGGAGCLYGGAGGGGGIGVNGYASGAGGAGGDGIVIIISHL